MIARMRCIKNHVVFMLQLKARCICRVLIRFLLVQIRWITCNQKRSGKWLSSKSNQPAR